MSELPSRRRDALAAGAIHYFTGKQCSNGHTARRYTSSGGCELCVIEHTKAWRHNYRDKALASNRKSSRKWREANKEKWRRGYIEAGRKWRLRNPERARISRREWDERNPESVRSKVRNRRARIRGAVGSHTAQDIEALLSRQRLRCAECGRDIKSSLDRHIDHITPLARGGSNDITNLQALCKQCNWQKSAMDPFDFARMRGRLI